MAFGITRKELERWKRDVSEGENRFFNALLAGRPLSGG